MDNIGDPDISFDSQGVCNYYYDFKNKLKLRVPNKKEGEIQLNKIIDRCISEKTRHDLDKDKNEDVSKFDLPIIGRSLQMQKVYKSIAKIVNTNGKNGGFAGASVVTE